MLNAALRTGYFAVPVILDDLFIERITRSERSNVNQLLDGMLVTPERADRGGGTGGPGTPERADRVPRNWGTAITNIEPSIEPSLNNNSEPPVISRDVVGVDSSEEKGTKMLISRGVHEPVATWLIERFGGDIIRKQVAPYDQGVLAESRQEERDPW